MVKIYVNGIEFEVSKNLTILQANEFVGNFIPHFCYHEKLLISGNCRMCLVEVERMPKPVASCSVLVSEGMKIFTNTPTVQKLRENVLEFLLINHPLDCPICDQGGECDLQNYSLVYGSDRSRFFEIKRGVSDKLFNPLIKSIMTRCIHCTRCVRFFNDICGLDFLGTTGRGTFTEIGMYFFNTLKTELSGNVIDLCPVGALTSKTYAFKARPWELRSITSIDIFDSFATPIEISFKNNEIYRIFPVKNFEVNSIWISDRTRFSFDSFNLQRLEDPLIKKGNQFIKTTWLNAFEFMHKNIKQGYISGIFGESLDIYTLYMFKKFLNVFGSSNLISSTKVTNYQADFVDSFIFNNTDFQELNLLDFVLLVGIDSRFDASNLNIKLKEASFQNFNFSSYSISKPLNLSFKNQQLGWNLNIFIQILEGKHKLSKVLLKSKKSLIVLHPDFKDLINFKVLQNKFKNINFIVYNSEISSLNSIFLGCSSYNFKESVFLRSSSLYYLESEISKTLKKNIFVIFQGNIGSDSLKYSNVILPTLSYFEKNNLYFNILGKFINTDKNILVYKNI